MSTAALQISRTCLQRTNSLQRLSTSSRLFVRAIATQSTRTKAPQSVVMVQATNVDVSSSFFVTLPSKTRSSKTTTAKTEPSRRIRRLSAGASSVDGKDDDKGGNEEDLLVDMEALEKLASQPPTPLRLRDMHTYATNGDAKQRLRNAQFLHKELPIRMAQRAMDLLTLPHGLNETTHVRNVARIYLKYIEMFQQMPPPTTQQEEREFTDALQGIVLDRKSIPMAIAQGINSWSKANPNADVKHLQEMEDALYRFFTARVGLRFLTQHHILSDVHRRNDVPDALDYAKTDLGCIQTDCNAVHEVQNAIDQVRAQTMDCYGVCPELELVDCSASEDKRGFTYVPHHLEFMVTELLKNACRATVDKYYGEEDMPKIRIVVVQGKEDVTIKVCDQGGGAPRSTMEKIWKFAHSTSPSLEQETEFAKDSFSGGKIRGFGLPLARIYARYFGGELTLRSLEGHGVDAYLYLPRLGHSCEKLPSAVKRSPGAKDSTAQDLYTMAPIVKRATETSNGRASEEQTPETDAAVLL